MGTDIIALTLSGGGSRAIAFHLGCMRALHDHGILKNIAVISSVSGGSVIGALYAYSHDDFDAFEARVKALLHRGIFCRALGHFLNPVFFLKWLGSLILVVPFNIILRLAFWLFKRRFRPPIIRRWATLTDALLYAIRKEIGNKDLKAVERSGLTVVINACELRSATSFRFGSEKAANWQLGTLEDGQVDVAFAVAASAAYPVLLPSLDRTFTFIKGEHRWRMRVALSDGGVFENLGISSVEPSDSPQKKSLHYPAKYILCCSAGSGQFRRSPVPSTFYRRISQTFETVFKKGQDAAMNRLFMHQKKGSMKGFMLAYLGMKDEELDASVVPEGFIGRRLVMGYPTDFSAMKKKNIRLLTERGRQVTNAVLAMHLPKDKHPSLYR
jgi:NTE family protein